MNSKFYIYRRNSTNNDLKNDDLRIFVEIENAVYEFIIISKNKKIKNATMKLITKYHIQEKETLNLLGFKEIPYFEFLFNNDLKKLIKESVKWLEEKKEQSVFNKYTITYKNILEKAKVI